MISSQVSQSQKSDCYWAKDNAIVGHGRGHFNNRPIYANNRDDVVIGGDLPLIRFGRNPFLYGTLMLGIVRADQALWLHEMEDIEMSYRAGRLSWRIRDNRLMKLTVFLNVVPTVGRTGMVVQLQAEGVEPSDRLVWTFGGLVAGMNPNASFDTVVSAKMLMRGFVAADAAGNSIELTEPGFHIRSLGTPSLRDSKIAVQGHALGRCSMVSELSMIDADRTITPADLCVSGNGPHSIVCGKSQVDAKPMYWGIIGIEKAGETDGGLPDDLSDLFAQGWKRGEDLAERVIVSTPEKRLDALACVSAAAIDGVWYPPCFVHSAMLWNMPFPGWRTIFAGTMYGWHDRVAKTAAYFIASQVVDSELKEAEADPDRLLTIQSKKSRFYGRGRISAHSGFYDMQSQFFDQLITEWRWNPDPDYEELLRPALDLHLEWMKDCFDPDGDGAYESYINSWPTDSVWYNGGGSCEATSYAYRGHQAARDMARRAGDQEKEKFHEETSSRIRDGFFRQLWVKRYGHPGKYREQGGHQRLHENPWLYGIFLPIDAGLLSGEQAATTLHYARAKLQNDEKPYGGRMVWNSNWVPAIWSTRVDWPGDNYALALAYFQAGFAEDGWEVFKGTFLTSAYYLNCPGNLGHASGGYDFGDCTHTFARTLVEGLFGYNPDYPNGQVELRPQFPVEWDNASICIPDVSLRYAMEENRLEYEVKLSSPAAIKIQIPVRARKIIKVQADGEPVPYQLLPGINTGLLFIELTTRRGVRISILLGEIFAPLAPLHMVGEVGDKIDICLDEGPIDHLENTQEIISQLEIASGCAEGVLANVAGKYLLLASFRMGETPLRRAIYLTIRDSAGETAAASQLLTTATAAKWQMVDLGSILNCDVRNIFKQKYLSPRPNTISLRIGIDGWTPWTSTFWGHNPPTILLENILRLTDSKGTLTTSQGAHFRWPAEDRNIAFTSLWDNFPDSVIVSVGSTRAEAIWLLIAGSTNPMQCEIANARVELKYEDGGIQAIDLIPPTNFWALAPLVISGSDLGQDGRFDYTDPIDGFCVPQPYPAHVQLGTNCRAMVYGIKLRQDVLFESISLKTLSQEVVIGLMAVSLMNPSSSQPQAPII